MVLLSVHDVIEPDKQFKCVSRLVGSKSSKHYSPVKFCNFLT